jgi:glycosyltransferase involved in cell wall biosynthesis
MAERFAVILPALNEEEAIAATLDELLGAAASHASSAVELAQIIVVDNGSTDRTAAVAQAHGAQVVSELRRGYGSACLAGIAALRPDVSIVAFMDADGSDDPADLAHVLEPIERAEAELVLGSRVLGEREAGSLTPHQAFGNRLATSLMRLLYGAHYSDLGPFRAIRRDALERLEMRDTTFGWTIEMQIKAAQQPFRVLEIPVRHRRRRGGESKIAGSLRGSILAGARIIWTILRHRFAYSSPR